MDTISQLNAALSGRYTIEREIGQGGMATVFLARDLRHDRHVALKLLKPDLGAAIGAERFLSEIKVTAKLQHPNLLPLFDSGEASGLLFYVMPFVEGESLRARLDRERQLPVDEAVRIVVAVANALDYAHRHGVIHRDLKPHNILLHEGQPLVADFGIALAVSMAGGARLTQTGLSLGSPQYMSPEQAAGERDVDGRTDVYALGCVLYEVLAGEPPFSGPTAQAVVAKHLSAPFPHVRHSRPDVPEAIDEVIRRATAKAPADRYPTAAAFAAALAVPVGGTAAVEPGPRGTVRATHSRWRTFKLIACIVVVCALLGYAAMSRLRSPATGGIKSIAVLPFENATRDSAQEYFSDGMTDEVASALANGSNMRVAARTSSYSFKGKHVTPQEVGQRLGVGHIVQGSVRQLGDKLHVTAELVSTKDGLSLWSQSFDRQTKDVYAVQNEITSAIVGALQVKLRGGSARMSHHDTPDLGAHDLYLRGRHVANVSSMRNTDAKLKALAYFRQALVLDSNYALAYAGIARLVGPDPDDSLWALREAAVKRALALDSTLAEAYSTAARIEMAYHRNFPAAKRDIDRAHSLDPSEPDAYLNEGLYWLAMRQPAHAVQAIRAALALDPVSPAVNSVASTAFLFANELDSVIAQHKRLAEIAPELATNDVPLGRAYILKGMYAQAESAFKSIDAFAPQNADARLGLAWLYAHTAHRSEATAIARAKEADWPKRYIPPELIAIIYAGLGESDRMYHWLDKGAAVHSVSTLFDGVDNFFQPYVREPRFRALLKRIGIPDEP
ncbi:MAG TPA: protein kinase [Gemmatimonadaceae bacterium]|nr:protein kinase [Gemmatimonadaceae bacterium]